MRENIEVERIIDDGPDLIEGYPGSFWREDVWIRVVYNRTEQKWKDAGNIETNIEYNFRNGYRDTQAGHVNMDFHGYWESRSGTYNLTEYLLCELSKAASIHQFTPDEFTTTTPFTTLWTTTW